MLAWLEDNQTWLFWIGGASVVLFFATMAAGPFMVCAIPADYFTHEHRPASRSARLPPVVRGLLRALRAVVAVVCLGAGLAMLVLPGQGLLTLLVGFLLLEFPGKYRLEKRVIGRPRIFRAANRLRSRFRRRPLVHPDEGGARAGPGSDVEPGAVGQAADGDARGDGGQE